MSDFPQCCVDNVGARGGVLCSADFCRRNQERTNQYCTAHNDAPCEPVPEEEYGNPCFCCCTHFRQCCIDNVAKEHGQLCTWDYCQTLQSRLNQYCQASGAPPCAAVPQEQLGQPCWCCCSVAFLYNAPIEVAGGDHVMAQDIAAHADRVLAGCYHAGDSAPTWQPRPVDYSRGLAPDGSGTEVDFDYMYYVAYQAEDSPEPPRFILATVDHLFLRPTGRVRPIQHLRPGDRLVNAHGGFSRVLFTVPARFSGALHHLGFEGFDTDRLDGHLLSVNGVVTADYSIQLIYSNGDLDPDLFDLPTAAERLRGEQDAASDANRAALDFVNDKTRWPAGMTPRAISAEG